MQPVLRITGHDVLTVIVGGLTTAQIDALRALTLSRESGADVKSAPLSFSTGLQTHPGRSPELILTGTRDQLKYIVGRIRSLNVLPSVFPEKTESLLDKYLRADYKINCKGKILDLQGRTHIMGILNATPDSFSDGGRFSGLESALMHAREMAAAGADIIDIGGESTRPGAEALPEEEELQRIIPLIERLSGELAVPLSVDTYKSSVAEKALQAGASIVNDISGLRFSPDMARVVADHGAALVIMHIKGTPRDMQQNPVYEDVIGEIRTYLEEGIAIAARAGVDPEKILVDPGIGFGKTLEHNLSILNRLSEFRSLGRPVVLGTSRKKFIGAILGIPAPDQRVDGTAATVALGIERGASVVRVHDVARMTQVARMTDAIVRASTKSQAPSSK